MSSRKLIQIGLQVKRWYTFMNNWKKIRDLEAIRFHIDDGYTGLSKFFKTPFVKDFIFCCNQLIVLKHNIFSHLPLYNNTLISRQILRRIQDSVKYVVFLWTDFTNIRNGLKALAIHLNSSIIDVWLIAKYNSELFFSRVSFNKIH